MLSDLNDRFMPAQKDVRVIFVKPAKDRRRRGDSISGRLLGEMHMRGKIHHYRILADDGVVYFVPPGWLSTHESRWAVFGASGGEDALILQCYREDPKRVMALMRAAQGAHGKPPEEFQQAIEAADEALHRERGGAVTTVRERLELLSRVVAMLELTPVHVAKHFRRRMVVS